MLEHLRDRVAEAPHDRGHADDGGDADDDPEDRQERAHLVGPQGAQGHGDRVRVESSLDHGCPVARRVGPPLFAPQGFDGIEPRGPHAQGVFGMSVITAVTAQNTQGVFAVEDISAEIIGKQIDAIFQDIEVDAVKIGMVSQISSIMIISEKLKQYKPKNLVLDPVMISKSGFSLLQPEAKRALIEKLITNL